MSQFEVFDNPIASIRRAYPYVVILQADLTETGRDRIVAPLVHRTRLSGTPGKLTPIVKVAGADHVLLVPRLSTMHADDLRESRGQLGRYRDAIVAALDYLFLGV